MNKYGRILHYLRGYKAKIFLYFICVLLSVVFTVISFAMLMPFLNLIFLGDSGMGSLTKAGGSQIIQKMNDTLVNIIQNGGVEGKINALLIICVIIFGATLLKNVFFYLSFYILNPVKNTIVNTLRQEIYDKILRLPIGYFTEKRKGDLMSRTTNDLSEVETSVVGVLEGWITYPLQIISYLVVLLVLSPQLTFFVLIFIPVMGFIIGRITRSLKKQSQEVAIKSGESVSILDETLGGLRVIKAFNVESILRNKFYTVNEDLLRSRNHISFRRDLASPMSEFLGVTMFCGILYFGGRLVLGQSINLAPASFLTYLAMFYNIINPAKSLSTSFSNVRKGSAAMHRIDEVLNAPVTVDENINGKQISSFNHSIEFRNVSFSYEDYSILKNINLTIKKGQTVALVGSSGAGKSTLADLVPRFHDVTSGELLIDGVNIKDYALKSIRQLMGIVTQEPILFNDTIANNIALGKEHALQEDIIKAAKIANAHTFIENKEETYQTNIGDRGSKLSGGERQRLTIARAVLKNPPILILDEATSSLDTESERLVQDAINHLMQDRTSIVIAHRLSTVRHADEIIVLQKGEIAERGTHDELLAKNGIYKRLVDMQEVK